MYTLTSIPTKFKRAKKLINIYLTTKQGSGIIYVKHSCNTLISAVLIQNNAIRTISMIHSFKPCNEKEDIVQEVYMEVKDFYRIKAAILNARQV